jgi:hypothetical protein
VPIVTATEILAAEHRDATSMYQRFRDFLVAQGVTKPRVKILPVFAVGRLEGASGDRLTDEALEGFERAQLQCAETRVIASDGVYACPILAGQPGARLSNGDLEASFRPAPLYHPTCVTCHQTGMTCRNA